MGRAFALRFVTVGRWPNVPQSSAKALGIIEGRCGPGFCPALRHGWPMAKCSSEQRESPWGIAGCCGSGFCPALRHGWPMARCSSEQRESPWSIEGRCGPGFCSALRHGVVCLQKSSRSCKILFYYTGYYRQNKALNCELFCSGYGAAPKNMTKDTTPLCFVL